MKMIVLLAALCAGVTGAYAANSSETPLLDGQTWVIDKSVSNSATCVSRIDTSVETPSPKDEYFVAYNDPYNGNPSGHLEIWSIGEMYYPRLDEVHVVEVGHNQIKLTIFANDFSGRRLLETKSLQAKLAASNGLATMQARQLDASGKTVEACDYSAL